MKITEYLNISHDTPYHEESILEHAIMCIKNSPKYLKRVALLHDIGKPFCKDGGKYYGHHSASVFAAYDFVDSTFLSKEDLYIINYHMAYYQKLKFFAENVPLWLRQDICQFALVDNKSRITNMPINELVKYPADRKQPNIKYDKELIMFVGPPGVGKDTFIKKHYPNVPVISRDDIVMEIADGKYSFDEIDQKRVDKILRERMQKFSKNYDRVIINMTNMSQKSRNRKLAFFQGWKVRYIVLIEPLSIIIRRNEIRQDKHLPEDILKDFIKRLYFPRYEDTDIYVSGIKID